MEEQFESRSCHTRVDLPDDLIAEILIRIPAKSVGKFRCVSTTWLSISTDPSFILAHARHAPESFLARIYPFEDNGSYRLLFPSPSGIIVKRLSLIFDIFQSSFNGLLLLQRRGGELHPSEFYVRNMITGVQIDLPNSNTIYKTYCSTMELYYHRWTGEYRIIYLCSGQGPERHRDVEILSLTAASSWRQIQSKAPFSFICYLLKFSQLNDKLYWINFEHPRTQTILAFDIFKETFSLLETPSLTDISYIDYGLVCIEGSLSCWIFHRDKICVTNFTVDIWTAVDGAEKWKKRCSLSLRVEDKHNWVYVHLKSTYYFINCCASVGDNEFFFLFTISRNLVYLLHWNFKSGTKSFRYIPCPLFSMQSYHPILYKETLVNVCHSSAAS